MIHVFAIYLPAWQNATCCPRYFVPGLDLVNLYFTMYSIGHTQGQSWISMTRHTKQSEIRHLMDWYNQVFQDIVLRMFQQRRRSWNDTSFCDLFAYLTERCMLSYILHTCLRPCQTQYQNTRLDILKGNAEFLWREITTQFIKMYADRTHKFRDRHLSLLRALYSTSMRYVKMDTSTISSSVDLVVCSASLGIMVWEKARKFIRIIFFMQRFDACFYTYWT